MRHRSSCWILVMPIISLLLITNPTLSIDPECYMTVPEVARYFGYPSEVHLVRTEDDYILEIHRIPHGRLQEGVASEKRPLVFLQHGILSDGFDWTPNLPNQSADPLQRYRVYFLQDRAFPLKY
ncbi:hypothetical protein KIN20_035222 [Parelaphostrongylus tenuis]|uniref:Partial AB-hydrolase lipase domain-containing protein n=1 Tax=Parelaphostrongylus tenuis TaxID=148309 RepID=A0AAD5RBF6_PARTN|nr:hypothetical protein KIN20_035222 [Parelaphostrongylus tenuis]